MLAPHDLPSPLLPTPPHRTLFTPSSILPHLIPSQRPTFTSPLLIDSTRLSKHFPIPSTTPIQQGSSQLPRAPQSTHITLHILQRETSCPEPPFRLKASTLSADLAPLVPRAISTPLHPLCLVGVNHLKKNRTKYYRPKYQQSN